MAKKGLYIAFEFEYKSNLFLKNNRSIDGIEKKIYFQFETFKKYGYEMMFYNPYVNRKHSIERIFRRLPYHYLYKWNFNYENLKDYSFIYIRKMWFMDGDLILFLKKVKSLYPSIKILLEIPTYPYDKEGKKIDMIPLKIKDKKWRKQLKYYVDRIITYSDHDSIFEIKTIKTSNAICMDSYRKRKINVDNRCINMIACGNLYYWHGFDRAIKGIANYYAKTPNIDLKLYIVGEGAELPVYKELLDKYQLHDHVVLTGSKYGDELESIYDLCNVGIDSMGRHRSGVYYNSSLKGKEYCAKGLIVISGVKTELDFYKNYPYYYRVPADDSAIDFTKFVDYYTKLLKNDNINNIQNTIQTFAREHFDFKIAMLPIIKFIEE